MPLQRLQLCTGFRLTDMFARRVSGSVPPDFLDVPQYRHGNNAEPPEAPVAHHYTAVPDGDDKEVAHITSDSQFHAGSMVHGVWGRVPVPIHYYSAHKSQMQRGYGHSYPRSDHPCCLVPAST